MKKLNLKRLLQKRNNGGFTLVEVVVSCALLSILVLGVFGFVSPVMSMISTGKKSARATLLAESIDSYISGQLDGAKYVAVYQAYVREFTKSGVAAMNGDKSKGLGKITQFMKKGDNIDKFEVRCISIRFVEDSISNKKKLMLTNEVINNNKSIINTTSIFQLITDDSDVNKYKVFDDAMYNGVYPVVTLETFPKDSDPKASGYKITTKVYGNENCYNSLEAERNKTPLAFEGSTYVKCMNMSEPAEEPTSGNLQSRIEQGASNGSGYTSGSFKYYYPDTYIYYAVLK